MARQSGVAVDKKEYLRKWYLSRKDIYKERHLQKKWGMTLEDLYNLMDSQNHECAICRIDLESLGPKRTHIDHCHKTDKIRGILCSNCNMALGLLKDDSELLIKAVKYLEMHNG